MGTQNRRLSRDTADSPTESNEGESVGLAKLSGTSVVASVHLIAGEVPVETLAATPARGMEQGLAVDVEQSVCFQKRGKISTIMLMTITTLDYSQGIFMRSTSKERPSKCIGFTVQTTKFLHGLDTFVYASLTFDHVIPSDLAQ